MGVILTVLKVDIVTLNFLLASARHRIAACVELEIFPPVSPSAKLRTFRLAESAPVNVEVIKDPG